ncbi:hypothetical protein [Hahella chejuensis]|uniref:hypothetical protein n=1 Tax=Hahella chejuensis TaxID=158327 RepID=UPI0011D103B2|nr:hypothetical protein [Hahella chejuensis]
MLGLIKCPHCKKFNTLEGRGIKVDPYTCRHCGNKSYRMPGVIFAVELGVALVGLYLIYTFLRVGLDSIVWHALGAVAILLTGLSCWPNLKVKDR